MKRSHVIIILVIIAVFLLIMRRGQEAQNAPAANNRTSYTVTNVNGEIRIPGTAYIEAFDPATNSNIPAINVRREARSALAPVCQLEDGDTVSVDDSVNADGSAWLHITSGSCSGWILSEFVTPES